MRRCANIYILPTSSTGKATIVDQEVFQLLPFVSNSPNTRQQKCKLMINFGSSELSDRTKWPRSQDLEGHHGLLNLKFLEIIAMIVSITLELAPPS